MPDRWPPALEIPRALNDDPAFHAAAPDAYVCALTREVMKNPAVRPTTSSFPTPRQKCEQLTIKSKFSY
jgi:hypothetical protein